MWQDERGLFLGSCSPPFWVSQELGFHVPRDLSASLTQKPLALFLEKLPFLDYQENIPVLFQSRKESEWPLGNFIT